MDYGKEKTKWNRHDRYIFHEIELRSWLWTRKEGTGRENRRSRKLVPLMTKTDGLKKDRNLSKVDLSPIWKPRLIDFPSVNGMPHCLLRSPAICFGTFWDRKIFDFTRLTRCPEIIQNFSRQSLVLCTLLSVPSPNSIRSSAKKRCEITGPFRVILIAFHPFLPFFFHRV